MILVPLMLNVTMQVFAMRRALFCIVCIFLMYVENTIDHMEAYLKIGLVIHSPI